MTTVEAYDGAVPPPWDEPAEQQRSADLLRFDTLADLCVRVDAAGPRRYLIRSVWPAAAYGVLGAEPKAGKTWNAFDLAVSVASGTPWLGRFDVDDPGPVLVLAGEGGEGNVVRRLRAIATARGITADTLPIVITTRAPHLNDVGHMAQLAEQLQALRPRLVVLDPLYLSAAGADAKDLYAMGAVLQTPQRLCDAVGAALLVVTHFNRQRDLHGAARFTGAGPAEWGRVLLAAAIVSRRTDPETFATTVVSDLHVTGGEVPDLTLRVRRTVYAVDPDDLDSPLVYAVDVVQDEPAAVEDERSDLHPAAEKLLDAVRRLGHPGTIRELVDLIAEKHGHGLARGTCSTHLNDLARRGLVDRLDSGRESLWSVVAEPPDPSPDR
ncbi:AAA family ATPase [Kineosporiaceae bacterium B12]|nr:AAA family ATPase [Kineococcus rubinsiae]